MTAWGSKITISIYVEGELPENAAHIAAKGAERELHATYDPVIDFVGAKVETVDERPKDQGAS